MGGGSGMSPQFGRYDHAAAPVPLLTRRPLACLTDWTLADWWPVPRHAPH